jgi:hypothetical protein
LQTLLMQLRTRLSEAPAAYAPLTKYIQEKAEAVENEATRDQPKWWQIQIEGEALLKAAKNLAMVTPTVLVIANQILQFISTHAR